MRLVAYTLFTSVLLIVGLFISAALLSRLQITLEERFWLYFREQQGMITPRSYLHEK